MLKLSSLVLALAAWSTVAYGSPAIVTDAPTKTLTEGAPCIVANAYQAGGCAIDVTLDTAPASSLTVTISADVGGKLVTVPTSVTFAAGTTGPRRVLMLGRQDADAVDELVTLTFAAAGYDSAAVAVTVIDDD